MGVSEDKLETVTKEVPASKDSLLRVARVLKPPSSRKFEKRVKDDRILLILPGAEEEWVKERKKKMDAVAFVPAAAQALPKGPTGSYWVKKEVCFNRVIRVCMSVSIYPLSRLVLFSCLFRLAFVRAWAPSQGLFSTQWRTARARTSTGL